MTVGVREGSDMNANAETTVERPLVLCTREGGVLTVTLNRGDRFNPLSTAMIATIQAELDGIAPAGGQGGL